MKKPRNRSSSALPVGLILLILAIASSFGSVKGIRAAPACTLSVDTLTIFKGKKKAAGAALFARDPG
ncbi:hypothetical protein UT4_20140 [Ferrigenium sp. UT4]